jgi:sterol desaturase/sphingolipid hydroxylase (fatty acid hydroxylase superfamily)
MALIAPCNILMGIYVHSGVELLPKWWNKTWFTKWFITATFHDQHHRYFKGNYGGHTTIWDWICGTVRPTYTTGFEAVTARPLTAPAGRSSK